MKKYTFGTHDEIVMHVCGLEIRGKYSRSHHNHVHNFCHALHLISSERYMHAGVCYQIRSLYSNLAEGLILYIFL